MTTSVMRARRRRGPSLFLPVFSALLVIGGVGLFLFNLVSFSDRQGILPSDVQAGGVQIGNLSSRDAAGSIEAVYSQPVTLYYEDNPILLDPVQVGFRVNVETMVAAIRAQDDVEGNEWAQFLDYLMGRQTVRSVQVPLAATYQESAVSQVLQDIAARYDRRSGQADFNLETLTLRPGSEGYQLDVNAALPLIDAALNDPVKRSVILPVVRSDINRGNIDTLREMIIAYLDSRGFIYDGQTTIASVYIQDLQTGEEVNILSDVAFSAASTIKVPILLDYFRYVWTAVPQDEAWLMANSLLCSNNSSSNLMMQIIGQRIPLESRPGGIDDDLFRGIWGVSQNATFLGARNTYITAPLVLGVAGQEFGSISPPQTSPNATYRANADPFNQTTPEDMGTLFSMIYDCANYGSGLMAAYPDGEYTQNECKQMIELMSANDLLRLLQGGIPEGVRIAHKNGWVEDMSGDAGIVFSPNGRHYVIAVYLWEQTEFQDYQKFWPIIEDISRAAWNYFNPEQPLVAPRTDLPVTAQECVGNFLPPEGQVDLNNINGWRADRLN
jgi:beta-lactamase class A